MTIIEDAVKKLEQARAARRKAEAELEPVGKLVEAPAPEESTDHEAVAAGDGVTSKDVSAVSAEAERAAPIDADDRGGNDDEAVAEANGHPGDSPNSVMATGASAAAMSFQLEDSAQRERSAAGEAETEEAQTGPAAGTRKVVVIDRQALRAAGLVPPEEEEHRLVDEFRNIKRPIVAHALGRRATKIEEGRLVMVASALAGEGKTFTCINLALSIAREQDLSVVLVDADVVKPHISRLFGVEDEPGLLDVLDQPKTYDYRDLVIDTDVKGLSILPAGRTRSHATELLSSERMEQLLRAYRKDNIQRLVLFDSPPLLQTPEARVLAGLVGQIALVVRADATPQHVVMDAIGSLDEGKAVNLILNQSRQANSSYYAGYPGYGYGYGSRSGGRGREDLSDSAG